MTLNHNQTIARVLPSLLLASGLLLGQAAHATQVVNSTVAAPSLVGANVIDAVDWMAESFSLATGSTLTGVSIQALDTDPALDLGQTFTVAVYADVSGLPGLDFNAGNQGQLFSTSVTYTGDGWNGVTGLQWKLGSGTYWLAVEAGSDPSNVGGLNLPVGATPAPSAVAYYSGGRNYSLTTAANDFGLRIDATAVAAVPEPSSWALVIAGLGMVGWVRRGKRGSTS